MQPDYKDTVSRPRLLLVGIFLSGFTSLLALVGMGVIAWQKMQSGQGWETYRTAWLVDFNWVGLLAVFAVAGLVFFVGLVYRIKEWLEIKALEKKYGDKQHG